MKDVIWTICSQTCRHSHTCDGGHGTLSSHHHVQSRDDCKLCSLISWSEKVSLLYYLPWVIQPTRPRDLTSTQRFHKKQVTGVTFRHLWCWQGYSGHPDSVLPLDIEIMSMNTEHCNDHTDQSLVRELLIWQTCPGHFLIQLLHHWPTHSRSESTMQCNAEISLRVPLDCPAAHQRAAAQARREIVTGWSWALTPLTQGWSWALTPLTQG